MINVEQAVASKFPGFSSKPALLRKSALSLLKHLLHETEINNFLEKNRDASGLEWIARVFERLDFSYSISARDRANIPASGGVMIYANHPIGSLDGLALLKLIGEVRGDVRIVANDLLSQLDAIDDLVIPIDNMTGSYRLKSFRGIIRELEQERAVIMFPAGEVSRAGPLGVRDAGWLPGFLLFARKAEVPLLPVHIKARNSLLFYSASLLSKPLGTALLSDEMFKHQSDVITMHVGEAIPPRQLHSRQIHDRVLIKRLRKHLYQLGHRQPAIFQTERTIAHPENRQHLQQEFSRGEKLGETRDGNLIYLLDCDHQSAVLREIGRMREIAFRKAGEGTGQRRDIDSYDLHYRHLVLWDRERLEIAGAYRLGEGSRILRHHGETGFYTGSLYDFAPAFRPVLQEGLELGRSFVNPGYWGKASLDYLWQGLGAYLAKNPHIRYLFGPVSMSAHYPRDLMDELVFYFLQYFPASRPLAHARTPYLPAEDTEEKLGREYDGLTREQGFDLLQLHFKQSGFKVPVMYRQYSSLFENSGFQVLLFSVDANFGDCLDGLCMADLTCLKANKRKRYIAAS